MKQKIKLHQPLAGSEWLFWVCPAGLPEYKLCSHAEGPLETEKMLFVSGTFRMTTHVTSKHI